MLSELEDAIGRIKKVHKKTIQQQTKQKLEEHCKNLRQYHSLIKECAENNMYCNTSSMVQALDEAGFTQIRVPGRVNIYKQAGSSQWQKEIRQLDNFINALTYKKKNGELVYISAKSLLDHHLGMTPEISTLIDFSFEGLFKKSLTPYVKPRNIHFIDSNDRILGKELYSHSGGLHCRVMEIPK